MKQPPIVIKSTIRRTTAALSLLLALGGGVQAATLVWNHSAGNWETSAAWTPGGPPGTGDIASFDPTVASVDAVVRNPTINSADVAGALNLNNNFFGGTYNFTGAGSLTTGSSAATGLNVRGFGTYSINIGTGGAASLTLSGSSASNTGAINVGYDASLVLTGNTVASLGANLTTLRGGTLVLDNSGGNPAAARFTSTGSIQLNGGGSALELRGASAGNGTAFAVTTGALSAAGAGDTFVRTVQNGAALSASFGSLARGNTSGTQFFENIGAGFIGDSGKPGITFTAAPTVRQGVISTSATATIPWAVVTSRSANTPTATVTGRWANYNGGVAAATTTAYSGDFSAAATGANVLFNPAAAGTVNLGTPANQLASVVLEPGTPGVTLNVGTGGQINTFGVMLSGANDLAVTGGSLFSVAVSTVRELLVLNPNTSLTTNSTLAASNGAVTTGGAGFIILSGTTNQVAFTSTQNFNVGGGTLRVTSANFDLTPAAAPTVRLRGGVVEYDVSGGSFTFNRALGVVAGNVNWASAAGPGANSGSGGFSAYSTTPGNVLNVNLGGAGAMVTWGGQSGTDLNFVQDGSALKFGSIKSNAVVNFQNPIAFDGGTAGAYLAREINVTGNVVANSGDSTVLTGVLSGTNTTDLIKTGTGTLVLGAANTYAGRTFVQGGTLLVNGSQSAATGNVQVVSGTLGGTGTVGGAATVAAGGTITGGASGAVGTLNLARALTINGTYVADVSNNSGHGDQLNVAGALNLGAGSTLTVNLTDTALTAAKYVLAMYSSLNGTFTTASVPAGYGLSYTGGGGAGELDLVPVPEPATWLGGLLLAAGAARGARRKRG